MKKLRLDALMTKILSLMPTFKKDSNEGIFFERQLEEIEKRAFEFKETELKYRDLIPVNSSINPGAQSYTYRMYGKIGMAKIVASNAKDLPRCDIYAEESTTKIKQLGTSFGYTTEDIRAALFTQTPLETNKASVARRCINELMSKLAFDGDSGYGINGFVGNANIPSAVAANGAGGSPLWANKTADEILADIQAIVTNIRTQSKGVYNANTLIMPIAQYNLISLKPRSTQSDLTILEYITKPGNSFGLTQVTWLPTELNGKFSGASNGMIAYEKSSENFEQIIPLEMQMLPAQDQNLEFLIPVEAKHGGTVVRYPLAFYIIYGI